MTLKPSEQTDSSSADAGKATPQPAHEKAVGPAAQRRLFLNLALANFSVGFGAFVVIAILPPLASDLGISSATAGWTMTAYAIAYAIGSPIGVAMTGRVDRRTVLTGGLAMFGVGGLMAALAPSLVTVLGARVVMAIGAGVVTPVAASVAIGLVPAKERGRALAYVFGGLTLAQAIGIPVGAWLGYTLGWRGTFLVAALLALSSAALLRLRLPTGLVVPITTLRALAQALQRPDLAVALLFTVLFMGGVWTLYTFFGPFFEYRLGIGGTGLGVLLLVFGIGAVFGNALGGRLTDRIGPDRTLALLCLAQMILMPVLTLFPFGGGSGSIAGAALLVLLWSLAGWSFMVPQQARLAALDPDLAPILFALNAAAIYVAASLGSLAGGAVLADAGFGPIGPVGAAIVLLALASLPVARRLAARQQLS
ncbi:MFS transporter [uncultured Roseobacter sp.]|uniref:MFS transporter n=1 Tax=uncultured Roseobacter sp. TaxID=114847 RepID=UPI002618F029|nr:MFS transporter [uncultured Roseobacter sp.]